MNKEKSKELFHSAEDISTWAYRPRRKSPWITCGPDGQRLTQDDIDALVSAEDEAEKRAEYMYDADKSMDADLPEEASNA